MKSIIELTNIHPSVYAGVRLIKRGRRRLEPQSGTLNNSRQLSPLCSDTPIKVLTRYRMGSSLMKRSNVFEYVSVKLKI